MKVSTAARGSLDLDLPRGRVRKERRRWCRGKVGVEHTLAIRPNDPKWHYSKQECGYSKNLPRKPWLCYEQEFCTDCGKILQHSIGTAACTVRRASEGGAECPEPLLPDRAGSVGRGVKSPPGSTTKSRRAGCVGGT